MKSRIIRDRLDINAFLSADKTTLNASRQQITCKELRDVIIPFLQENLNASPNIKILNLSDNSIDAEGAILLANFLKTNTTITEVNLRNNHIHDSGLVAIANALHHNATLESLDVSYDFPKFDTVLALMALSRNTQLKKVSIHYTLEGCSHDTFSCKNTILSHNDVSNLITFLQQRPEIKTLILSNCSLGYGEVKLLAEFVLQSNSNITSLSLTDNNIDDDRTIMLAKMLKQNKTLVSLKLDIYWTTKNGVLALTSALESNDTLTKLTLTNSIMILTMDVVFSLRLLQERNPSFSLIVNKSYERIWKTQETIDLNSFQVTDNDVITYIIPYLNRHPEIKTVDLSSNQITAKGAMALAEQLSKTQLTVLNLQRNSVGYQGVFALNSANKKNNHKTVIQYRGYLDDFCSSSDFFQCVSNNTLCLNSMNTTSLYDKYTLSVADVKDIIIPYLTRHPEITSLNLNGFTLNDDALIALLESKNNITHLSLRGYSELNDSAIVSKQVMLALSKNTQLTSLDLSYNVVIHISTNTNLKTLKLENALSKFNIDGVIEQLTNHPTLEILDLSYNPTLQNTDLAHLVNSKTLTTVNLKRCALALSAKDIDRLTASTIIHLDLSANTFLDGSAERLANGKFETLSLEYCFITSTDVKALLKNKSLKTLSLRNNRIENNIDDELLQLMSTNETLLDLDLSVNYNFNSHCCTALSVNNTLKRLVMSDCDLRNHVILLGKNTSLIYLDISNNFVSDADACALILALAENNPMIQGLNLRGNEIGDQTANVLLKLPNLTVLDVSNNKITDVGIELLLGATNIKELNIQGNFDKHGDEHKKVVKAKKPHKRSQYSNTVPTLFCMAAYTVLSTDQPQVGLPKDVKDKLAKM